MDLMTYTVKEKNNLWQVNSIDEIIVFLDTRRKTTNEDLVQKLMWLTLYFWMPLVNQMSIIGDLLNNKKIITSYKNR